MNTVILQLRIQFDFEDVFGKRVMEEAYFSGWSTRKPREALTQTDLGQTEWSDKLTRMTKPKEWRAAKQQDQAQQAASSA